YSLVRESEIISHEILKSIEKERARAKRRESGERARDQKGKLEKHRIRGPGAMRAMCCATRSVVLFSLFFLLLAAQRARVSCATRNVV
ncbi:hypothetical protein A2U01_0030446, partial [Trifolium medium]|nr:hypothetical protein [Trifolium medium]